MTHDTHPWKHWLSEARAAYRDERAGGQSRRDALAWVWAYRPFSAREARKYDAKYGR